MHIKLKRVCYWLLIAHVLFSFMCFLFCCTVRMDLLTDGYTRYSARTVNITTREKTELHKMKQFSVKTHTQNAQDFEIFRAPDICSNVTFPFHLSRVDTWSPVNENKDAYVFAAYFVENERKIVIIGAKSRTLPAPYCQLWYQMQERKYTLKLETSAAKYILLSEGRGLRYSAALFECILPSPSLIPTYVSIVTNSCHTPLNLLPVQPAIKQETYERRFTVCLSPLNFQYARDYELVEWIELNRILGAEKFIVYNYSSAINIARVLDFYSKRGLTDVVQWRLPMRVNTHPTEHEPIEIYYFGQVAALNDCLYRNKQHSEFIVNLDLDEFIIPHSDNVTSWAGMMHQLDYSARSYLFRNTFFKKEWNNADIQILNKTLVDKLRLVTLQKMQRERKIYLPRQRSKYIARTADVSHVMIHNVHSNKVENVPTDVGLLHHYRNWEVTNDPPQIKLVDKTVSNKFGQLLIKHVLKCWSDLDLEERKDVANTNR